MPQDLEPQHPRRDFMALGGAAAGVLFGSLLAPPSPAHAADPVTSVNGLTGDVVLTPASLGALSQAAADQMSVVVDAVRYPGLDPSGAADSTLALQAAMGDVPDGGRLLLPAGRYRVDGTLSVAPGRSVAIEGYGAVLIHAGSGPLITAVAAYESPVSVTAIATADRAFPSGASAPVSTLTTAAATDWTTGTVLKLVSDDEIPEARPGSDGRASRRGEFVSVEQVSGTEVVLAGVARDVYETNVRAVRVPTQTFSLEGVTLDVSDAGWSGSFGVTVHLVGLMAPIVRNVRVRRASSIALQLTSCLGYSVENLVVDQVAEDLGQGKLGYGILDNCGVSGRITGGSFRLVRHAYTDDTPRVTAGSDVRYFGRTFGTKVVGVSAAMTTNNAFDTHHCSEGVEFIACTARGGVPRQDRGYAGFGLRGRRHRVVGCTSWDMETGVTVFTEGGGGRSYGHVVSDLVVHRSTGPAVYVNLHGDSHPSARTREPEIAVHASGITALECRKLLQVANATAYLRDATFIVPSGVDGVEYNGITNRNAYLDIRDVLLDYSRNVAGKPQPVLGISSGSSWTPGTQDSVLANIAIRASESVTSRTTRPFIGGTHRLRGRNIEFSHIFTVLPGDREASSVIEWRCASEPGASEQDQNSAYFYLSAADLTSPMAKVRQSPDPNVVVKVNPSTSSPTTSEFLPGYFRGQVVHFWIQDTISGSWTVPHGDQYGIRLVGLAERTLRRRDQLSIFWDGVVWRELA